MAASHPVAGRDIGDGHGEERHARHQEQRVEHMKSPYRISVRLMAALIAVIDRPLPIKNRERIRRPGIKFS
jgi:hypothetical protein